MTNKIIFQKVSVILLLLCTASCNTTEPPDPPPGDIVYNTIILTVEWADLYRIKIKWNKATSDTLTPFTYRLKQLDESGNQTTKDFIIVGNDTTYVIGEPDSLNQGARFWFKVEGYNAENTLKDTSQTISAQTLQPTSHNIVWTIDTLGQPGDLLYDIWGLDENNVYAIGGINMTEGVTSIIKWDGEKWNYHSWPEGGANGIWGFSENNIFIVGEYSNRGFIGHYDGSLWTEYRSEYFLSKGDTVYPLRSVWGSSPDDVWAVGDFGTIIHWNGVEWRKVNNPLNLTIIDVFGSDKKNVFVLQRSVDNTSTVARYNGVIWEVLTDRIPDGPKNFNSIWIDKSGTGYVVGNSALHFNGQWFERININQSSYSVRVRGRNAADVIVTGQRRRVYHFNGFDWVNFPELEDNSGAFSEISGIQIFENKIFLVGRTLNRALIYTGEKQ